MSDKDNTEETTKGRDIAGGAIVGGVAGAALGPIGAAVGAAVGGALGGGTKEDGDAPAHSAVEGRGPSDEGYADTETDADWRGSAEGLTSVGASDQNADTAIAPSDQPGVRRGDPDTARETLERSRSNIIGDQTDDDTGRDAGAFLNSGEEVSAPTSPTSSSSTASLPPE